MKRLKGKGDKNHRALDNKSLARGYLEAGCILYELGERKESTRLLFMAATLGNLEAQVNLANIYDDGDGLPINIKLAHYWYRRAVRGGSSQAAYNLGISFTNRKNFRWGRYWFERAMYMGDEDAEYKIKDIAERDKRKA